MLDKKGAIGSMLDWFIAILFTIGALLSIFILVSSFSSKEINTSELKAEAYFLKLYYSPHMININDPITGVQTGFIDLNKFSSANLNLNNNYQGERLGARLILYDQNMKLITNANIENPIYDHKTYFDQLLPVALNQLKGKGGAIFEKKIFPIKYEYNNKINFGYLEVSVVVARS